MNDRPLTEFRSSGRPGFSSEVGASPRRVKARKRERAVQVRFALAACTIESPEGVVQARAGDAILTGTAGEQWRVSRARFPGKYHPLPPTAAGEDGTYISTPIDVLAVPLAQAFTVVLADGESRLYGHPGDWLVDYGDGSFGVVAARLFPTIYEILAQPRSRPLHQRIEGLLLLGIRLNTPRARDKPKPPPGLLPLIEAVGPAHAAFDERAVEYGHRYRSAFWAIYVLSAVAVLCAVMPLALGWDDSRHLLHPFAGIWAAGEVGIIGAVGAIYSLGHRRDWQGQWLGARTQAELTWYLPLVAPLVDFTRGDGNWYARVFEPGPPLESADDVNALCATNESLARTLLASAWSDPNFVAGYVRWTVEILEGQRNYHIHVAAKHHALQHRVHGVNNWLYSLTAAGALAHLAIHSLWLSLGTTFFPALGASLHGALAQSESYRLSVTSERLVAELGRAIENVQQAARETDAAAAARALRAAVRSAVALILDEHQDWHMLVRPHHLPLG
jgi:PGDYG protein